MAYSDVEVVLAACGALNRRDRGAFLALVHDDAEIVPWRAVLEDTVFSGPGAAGRFYDESERTWATLRFDVEECRQVGDRVLAVGRLVGTARASEVPVESPVGFVFVVRQGKLRSGRTFHDPHEARAAAAEPQ